MNLNTITTYQSGVVQSAAYRNLNKIFSDLLHKHGLSCMQWFLLGTILDAGTSGITLTHLSEKLQTGLPFITNSVNLLQSKGMVERKDNIADNRSKLVSINPRFVKECKQIEQDLRVRLSQSIYKDIAPADLQIYVKVLYQLSNLIR